MVILLGLALRALPLSAHRFHEDEALYAFWALNTRADPALLQPYIDKPPAHIYSLAAAERILGSSEEVFRLPSLVSSTVSIALVYAIARRIYDDRVALLAALLFAASPFAMLFAPTAFTDSTLVLWMLAALLGVLHKRFVLGGLALGLAYATKQTSIMVIPLVFAGAIAAGRTVHSRSLRSERGRSCRHWSIRWLTLLAGFVPPFALVTWWDSLRWASRPSFWDRSLVTYGGLGFVPATDWVERAADWLGLLRYVFVSPVLNSLLVAAVATVLIEAVFALRLKGWSGISSSRAFDLLLLTYSSAFLIGHVLIGFRVWDRYLLVLVPTVCLIFAAGLHRVVVLVLKAVSRYLGPGRDHGTITHPRLSSATAIAILIVVLGLAIPVRRAAAGEIPIGGDHGTYDGIDGLADYVRSHVPSMAKIYYHWSGWHLSYYLYGAPQRLEWYPSADALLSQVNAGAPEDQALLVLPDWKDTVQLRGTLDRHGITLESLFCAARPDGGCAFDLVRIHGAIGQSKETQIGAVR